MKKIHFERKHRTHPWTHSQSQSESILSLSFLLLIRAHAAVASKILKECNEISSAAFHCLWIIITPVTPALLSFKLQLLI